MDRPSGYLAACDIEVLWERVTRFLARKGVKVQHRGVLEIVAAAGATVDFGTQRVRFSETLVNRLLAHAPRGFTLSGADPEHDLVMPADAHQFYLCTNTGARNIVDPISGETRPVTRTAITRWGRLVEGLQQVNVCAVPTACDAPPEAVDIHGLRALALGTRKHIWVQPHSEATLPYLFRLAQARAGGAKQYRKRPSVSFMATSLTPFQFKSMDMEVVLQACRHGAPVHACSVPTLGGTAPITPAGAVVLAGVEVLALTLIIQAVKPGTPVLGLATALYMEMRNGKALKAHDQAVRTNAACAQFIRRALKIPVHVCGLTTDTVVPDGQSMAERALSGMVLAGNGVDIMGRAGELEAAQTISPAQLVIDNEIAAMIKQLVAPMDLSEEAMAWSELMDVEPGGHFLEQPGTLTHCRDGLPRPLFAGGVREAFEAGRNADLTARASALAAKQVGENYSPRGIPGSPQDEWDRIVAEADRVLISNV